MLISAISFDTQEVRDKFTEFYELYAVELIYFASNLIKDTSLAQDIVHDTLIHYIESQDELGCFTSDRTRALLFTCVRNRAYNMCKHRKYEIQEGDKLDTYETPALTVLDRLIKEENISFLYKELFRLDPDLQTLLQLKYYYKLSSKRIAIVVLLVGSLTCLLLQSEKVRAAFNTFFMQFNKGDMDFGTEGLDDVSHLENPAGFHLEYVPEGYYLSTSNVHENSLYASYQYTNNTGNFFAFDISSQISASITSIDTESHTQETFVIDDITFYFFTSTDESDLFNLLLWANDYNSFLLSGYLPKEEMIKIYENLIYTAPE